MKNTNNKGLSKKIVSVGDASVSTNGSWIINTPPRGGKSQSSSSNSNKNGGDKDDSSDKGFGVSFSTRNISSWLHLQFEGTEVEVHGAITPGSGNLVANYIVDAEARNRSVPALADAAGQNSTLGDVMLFRSGKLDAGNHDLTIETVEMDANRTYTLKYFLVTPSPPPKQKNVGAIVGGVLGSIALMVLLLVGYFVWKRRKTSQRDSRRIRHMVYPDPMNHGNWNQGAYSWYSYMDTDSKYTFNHMSREFSEDPRPKRVSWVPASFLPTSSRSSVSYGSSPDWTSHRGTMPLRSAILYRYLRVASETLLYRSSQMTRVLVPVWSVQNGIRVQKLKAMPQPPVKPARGMTPPALNSEVHVERCLAQLRSKDKNIEKYIYLSQLKLSDENMFYHLCVNNMPEITPLIYTPTVGDACLQFSHNYRRPEGIFVSIEDKGNIRSVLESWPRKEEARISVVTDGSRILGLGDLGVNGMPISCGKLSLYIAGAGIRPSSTIPICLDLGTNNEKYLEDPFYLGIRRKRISEQEMTEFMEEFMREMRAVFPKLLVQFEDFSTEKAFTYLDAFRERYPVFNDDIQGTGAVILSGFVNAAKLASAAAGTPLGEQRILFFGAGSAGVGVAMQLMSFFVLQGMSREEARRRIWFVDSQGLIYDARGSMAEHKKYFSRNDYQGPPMKNLLDIVEYVRPTALLGLSTISGAFNEDVIRAMARLNARPIIFPLSNPVRLSECQYEETVEWTDGKVVFASGNNMYVFPGLGLGAILSRSSKVTDKMVETASLALADSLTEEERSLDLIYPRIERIRDISAHIALSVVRQSQKEGVDQHADLRSLSDEELLTYIKNRMWNPRI
ncbi:malic enzyme [Pyrrhoderma noxium]|uniref:Malic enzyme n=1 Tax=Pyrrhoderma noxium TaxID=2282107 RepID=A0A286U760_9AGAM|nr:malic enzyme [Pyrrhoderma noxium]